MARLYRASRFSRSSRRFRSRDSAARRRAPQQVLHKNQELGIVTKQDESRAGERSPALFVFSVSSERRSTLAEAADWYSIMHVADDRNRPPGRRIRRRPVEALDGHLLAEDADLWLAFGNHHRNGLGARRRYGFDSGRPGAAADAIHEVGHLPELVLHDRARSRACCPSSARRWWRCSASTRDSPSPALPSTCADCGDRT